MFKFWSRHELFFATIYFVQAAVGISGIAQFMFTRNELKLSFIELGLLGAMPVVAWSMKPLYGFLTDLVPIFGYRRRSYLHIAPLITVLSWLFIWKFGTDFTSFAIPLIIANVGLGFADVICDGLVVETSTKETVGRYQAICWGSLSVGSIITSFFSGFLLTRDILDIRQMFLITAFLPLITFVLSFFVKEERYSHKSEARAHIAISGPYILLALVALGITILSLIPQLGFGPGTSSLIVIGAWLGWIAIYFRHLLRLHMTSNVIVFVALFLFLWRFTPSFGAPWEDFYLNILKISPEKFGFFGIISSLGWFVGSVLYAKIFDKFRLKKLLLWTVLLSALFSFSQLLISHHDIGEVVGNFPVIKYFSAIITAPVYLLAYGKDFWSESMNQYSLINVEYFLDFFLGILYMISFLPLQKLAVEFTPKNVEATNFSVMASIMNLGLMFGTISGGYIYENIQNGFQLFGSTLSGLDVTVLLGAVTTLICLAVLPYVRASSLK